MSTNTKPKCYTIDEILEMIQTEKGGPPDDADGAKSWHDWFKSEEWQTTIQACRFAVALGASSNATIYPSKVAELARRFANAEPVTQQNETPLPYVGEQKKRIRGITKTIIFHGDKSYSYNGGQPALVTTEQHSILQMFIGKQTAISTKTLRSEVENPSRVIESLKKKFPKAVRQPKRRGDGYYIAVIKGDVF